MCSPRPDKADHHMYRSTHYPRHSLPQRPNTGLPAAGAPVPAAQPGPPTPLLVSFHALAAGWHGHTPKLPGFLLDLVRRCFPFLISVCQYTLSTVNHRPSSFFGPLFVSAPPLRLLSPVAVNGIRGLLVGFFLQSRSLAHTIISRFGIFSSLSLPPASITLINNSPCIAPFLDGLALHCPLTFPGKHESDIDLY